MPNCGICGGDFKLLGILGDLAHVRCINCGLDWSFNVDENPDVDGGDFD